MATHSDIQAMPSGAQWLKADLHVHTPGSLDIGDRWRQATPADVVRVAIDKGLNVIGVTDHNTAAWCDRVRAAARDTSLTVLPGVEISTPQGHLLALFDTQTAASVIEDLLVSVGIRRDEFGSLEAATAGGIIDVAKAIAQAGGVAIAAHADGERGFMKMIKVGIERQRAYAASDLWAMEVLDASLKSSYQAGTVSKYPRRMPCIQSSDCWPKGADRHDLDGMAYRFSHLKMDDRSLSGLKLALIDPELRVRLPGDEARAPADGIVGMWVTGGFLDGQQIRLNDNVNCFIGDTGSGKSLVIELLRFALAQQASVPKIRQEVTRHLAEQLGNLSRVHVLLRKGNAYYLVQRAWSSPAEPPLVQRVLGDDLETLDGELDMRLFFPIKAFSQSEIIEFAREPMVRLSLTDDLIDRSVEIAAIKDLKVRLRKNATSILTERQKAKNITDQLAEFPTLVESKRELDKALKDPRLTDHQRWYKEQGHLDGAHAEFESLPALVDEVVPTLELSVSLSDDISDLPSEDLMTELRVILEEWHAKVVATDEELRKAHTALVKKLGELRTRWKERFDKAEEEYQRLLLSIDKNGAGLQTLSRRRRNIEKQITTLEDRKKELEDQIGPQLQKLEAERETLLDQLQGHRRAITSKREAKAKDLSGKLSEKVRLAVRARASTGDLRAALDTIATGSRLQAPDLDRLASCHPVTLVKSLLVQDWATLTSQSGIEEAKLIRLWDTIVERDRLEDLYALQLTDVEDIINVMLLVDSQGTYKPLEDLSHGQKCMVVLMVALAEGEFPLLVDQPEDALHAPGIESGIVATLRSRRDVRQCVFATRNANILVSADAEQIIAMQADATRGQVARTGSLDSFDQRQLVIHHVEGGEEALRRRQTMYALRPLP